MKVISDMTFTLDDLARVVFPYSDYLVMTVTIDGQRIHRVLLNGGAGVFRIVMQEFYVEDINSPYNYILG